MHSTHFILLVVTLAWLAAAIGLVAIHCQPGTLDALYEEFRAKGVPMLDGFEGGPVTRPYGIRDFSVIDPDGYDLVFGEEC